MEESKIQEIQMLEQNLQNLLFQKQAFQMELSETQAALKEIEKADDEVFKIIGQLMIKTNKSEVKKDLLNKQKLLEMRMKTIEKQESALSKRIEEIKEEFIKSRDKQEK